MLCVCLGIGQVLHCNLQACSLQVNCGTVVCNRGAMRGVLVALPSTSFEYTHVLVNDTNPTYPTCFLLYV